jgi:3',5'-cyclic AMP phosphodiesterase CpdA
MKSCDFVLTGGDLIEDGLGTRYEIVHECYDLAEELIAGLSPPVYHTMGNHDLFGIFVESGATPEHPDYGKEMYRRRIGNGRTYYSFDHRNWHFISLDSTQVEGRQFFGGIDKEQLDWLRSDLDTTGHERPICLCMHIPMASAWVQLRHGILVGPSPQGFTGNNKELYLAVEPHNVRLVLGGHLHILEDWSFRGTRFINAGAVRGGWGPGPLDGPSPSFGVVTVDGEEIVYEHVPIPGE